MDAKTVIMNKNKTKGVVIMDSFNMCTIDEVLVVYEGETKAQKTLLQDLVVLGPENAIGNFNKCRDDKRFCIFLTNSPCGLRCERYGAKRNILKCEALYAPPSYEPKEMYPHCQHSAD